MGFYPSLQWETNAVLLPVFSTSVFSSVFFQDCLMFYVCFLFLIPPADICFFFPKDRLVHSISHVGTQTIQQTAFLYICEAVYFSFHCLLLWWSVHLCYTSETGLKLVKIDLVLSASWSAPIQGDASEETTASSLQNLIIFLSSANDKHKSNHSGKFPLQNPGGAMM